MQTYNKDKVLKFEYNPVNDKEIQQDNEVGATGSTTTSTGFYEIDYIPTDFNTIYVSTGGSDITGDGTYANPVKTLDKAELLCVANNIHNVIILDSETYEFDGTTEDGIQKVYAQKGETPTITPKLGAVSEIDEIVGLTKHPTYQSVSLGLRTLNNGNVLINGSPYPVSFGSIYLETRNPTGGVAQSITGVTISEYAQTSGNSAVTPSGHIFIPYWNANSSRPWATIRKSDFSEEVEPQLYFDAAAAPNNAYALSNNNVVVLCATASNNIYMMISDGKTLEPITSSAVLVKSSAANSAAFVAEGDDGNIYIFYDNEIKKYTINGEYLTTTIISFGKIRAATKLFNGNLSLIVEDDLKIYNMIYNPKTDEEIYLGDYIDSVGYGFYFGECGSRMVTTRDGNAVVSYIYRQAASPSSDFEARYFVLDQDGNLILSPQIIAANMSICICAKYNNNNVFIMCKNQTDHYFYYTIVNFSINGIKILTESELHGITLTTNNKYSAQNVIYISDNLKLKWCTINNSETPYYWIVTKSIGGIGNVETYNTLYENVDAGIHITGDLISENCQYVSCNKGNSHELTNTTGATRIVNNDFAHNYGGTRLINNSGNEIIKNNIYYRSGDAINADTPVVYSHSINTGTAVGVSSTGDIYNVNPLYINDGLFNQSLRNLNLKNRILGYVTDSLAIGLADDGGNAGSLKVSYIGEGETWTEAIVDKDLYGIEVEYSPIGSVKTERKDGSVSSYKDALSEIVTIKWRAISNADYEKIYNMVLSNNTRVRIYFDPISEPTIYDEYTLVYDKLSGSPGDVVKFSRTGKTKVELVFQRAAT